MIKERSIELTERTVGNTLTCAICGGTILPWEDFCRDGFRAAHIECMEGEDDETV